jgi:alkylation response protein AidB-like acyl-CoA dehydrogenase
MARREGDGWVLDGVKSSVSFLNADVFYSFVRSDPKATGWKSISAFLVPREASNQLEMARWQCYRVQWMRQNQIPCQREGAMVKWFAPRAATEAIHRCLLLHGHRGYSMDLPIQQRLRDVIGWQIGDGAEEVMKLIVARELVQRGASPWIGSVGAEAPQTDLDLEP